MNPIKRVNVVLHRPIYPRNVGMCARAMGNLGAQRLIIVDPRCDVTCEEAKQGAAHAQDILRAAVIYRSLSEFLGSEGEGVRLALSGRDGRLKRPDGLEPVLERYTLDPSHRFFDKTVPIYMMFGPEDDGLSNEEMELCHQVCNLPSTQEIPSLNLSHAVLLSLFIVRSALEKAFRSEGEAAHPKLEDSSSETMTDWRADSRGNSRIDPLAEPWDKSRGPSHAELSGEALSSAPVYFPGEAIKRWLEALGFDLSARRVNIEKTLNRILLSRCPSPEELRILNTVIQQTVRKLNGSK